MQINRRKSERLEFMQSCRISYDGIIVKGKLLNISTEGLRLESTLPGLDINKIISIEIDTGVQSKNRFIQIELKIKNLIQNQGCFLIGGQLLSNFDVFRHWLEQLVNKFKSGTSHFMQHLSAHQVHTA
ncbi:hypothetical protein THMIRHAS_01270 [Thiosulfatimonas sediminis]|uniref:PilZ domain-containing protein n=1 Tax=Thiosulfatimonas sediminis TaxID=2675054 RepID=A0A6F8PRU0_9GAMM|nr:PilZ domain-containing protein [Thiosulfatimonas sediminis]BBP44754.1 hypothetical protein THMIRHAS_01270 [Thiosulfatimonas sediminis]